MIVDEASNGDGTMPGKNWFQVMDKEKFAAQANNEYERQLLSSVLEPTGMTRVGVPGLGHCGFCAISVCATGPLEELRMTEN